MRNVHVRLSAVLGILLLYSACATGSNMSTQYRRSVGTAAPGQMGDQVERILRRFQFEIARHENDPNSMVWETRWRGRVPFEDEYELGVNEARTRVIVEARPSRRIGGSIEQYRVYMTFENEVIRSGSPEWVRMDLTPQFEAWADEIMGELEELLRTGIRVR